LILDGFPRHVDQVALADEVLSDWAAVYVDTPEYLLRSRTLGRWTCNRCGWSVSNMPSSPVCPHCAHHQLSQRDEDSTEGLATRLTQTRICLKPLLTLLDTRGRLLRLDGTRAPADNAALLSTLLRDRPAHCGRGSTAAC
jgi:adenylate kinase family enzyme